MDHRRNLWWVAAAALVLTLGGGLFIGLGLGRHDLPLPMSLGIVMLSTALLLASVWVLNTHIERNRRQAVTSVEAAANQLDERLDALADDVVARLNRLGALIITLRSPPQITPAERADIDQMDEEWRRDEP